MENRQRQGGDKADDPRKLDRQRQAQEQRDSENPRGPDGRPINPQKTDKPGSGQF